MYLYLVWSQFMEALNFYLIYVRHLELINDSMFIILFYALRLMGH